MLTNEEFYSSINLKMEAFQSQFILKLDRFFEDQIISVDSLMLLVGKYFTFEYETLIFNGKNDEIISRLYESYMKKQDVIKQVCELKTYRSEYEKLAKLKIIEIVSDATIWSGKVLVR